MRLLKRGFLVCFIILLYAAVALTVGAYETKEYTVTESDGGYSLYDAEDVTRPLLTSESLTDIVSELSEGAEVYFSDISVSEGMVLSGGRYHFSGKITFTDTAGISVDGAELTLSDIDITLLKPIRVKRGNLTFSSGQISAKECAVSLDHTSAASFVMDGGAIKTSYDGAAVDLIYGSAVICGGRIENTEGVAINASSTVFLSSSPQIVGKDYGIVTTAPLFLSYGGTPFSSEVGVKYLSEFEKGSITPVFYGVGDGVADGIQLYDSNGRLQDLSYFDCYDGVDERGFAAVYLPYCVKVFCSDELILTEYKLKGELLSFVAPKELAGFEFVGWRVGDGTYFEFDAPISSDVDLFSEYRLCPPSYELSSLSFTYNSLVRELSVREVSHPRLADGIISYHWYKDGVDTGIYSRSIGVKDVCDSGSYHCVITFTLDGQSVSVTTAAAEVVIKKCEIETPTPTVTVYNGMIQYHDLKSTALYTVEEACGRLAGTYPVKLTLCDRENYKFVGTDREYVYADFTILQAENFWREELNIRDLYEGQAPSPYASAGFGEVTYLYGEDPGGPFSSAVPTSPGKYYVKATVSGNENFTELSSAAVPFSIIRECVTGLSVITYPNKREYLAFDSFDGAGLTVGVTYNSGRTETVGAAEMSVIYKQGDTLRYGDGAVTLEYGGMLVSVGVSVEKRSYDLSGIGFFDVELEFDGAEHSASFSGELPIGLDGIRLEGQVMGSYSAAGIYTVTLVFQSESKDYHTPSPVSATLKIRQKSVTAVWDNTAFTYDGGIKQPSAYYCDVYGRKVVLSVSGGRSYAGEYVATAAVLDNNYTLTNPTCNFFVAKADYDMSGISWSDDAFVYDGSEKRVFLSDLPSGVSVVGYLNNLGVDAGQYTAVATLSYDERNYNPPTPPSYTWTIEKSEYCLDGFYFSDAVFVYDGDLHYPILFGNMPMGVDGSELKYCFTSGAKNVSEGKKLVLIEFSTDSKNYVAPQSVSAYVTITPKPITVIWSGLEFTYTGQAVLPTAEAAECAVSVVGEATDAGEHTAYATALDTNYALENAEETFVILKAQNAWDTELSIADVYFGGTPAPIAVAKGGSVYYRYYTDGDCTDEVLLPTEVGVYYAVAHSDGDNNYLTITSDAVKFSILAVLPIELFVTLNRTDFIALDPILPEDFTLYLKNNDGSVTEVSSALAAIVYPDGECLYFGDTAVNISYGGFSSVLAVTVNKRSFDLSEVRWDGLYHTYDGGLKSAVLVNLPSGISVTAYLGNNAVFAGEYTVSALIEYDSVNYEAPILPSAIMKIEKQVVQLPSISGWEYCGRPIAPELSQSELYSFSVFEVISAGEYLVEISLNDAANYVFSSGSSVENLPFTVTKRPITVKISDATLYRFSKVEELSHSFDLVEGSLIAGDILVCDYLVNGDSISAHFLDTDYEITVIPGKIVRAEQLSEEGRTRLLLILLFALTGLLVLVAILLNRKRLCAYYKEVLCHSDEGGNNAAEIGKDIRDNITPPGEIALPEGEENIEITEQNETEPITLPPIDAVYADSLITDALAKNLIRKDEYIETYGSRKGIVNVDTLSRSFKDGDRIDVNILKSNKLVPYDTAYIKVLARGAIDKSLTVYANDFSLSAVKMIALAGGKAVKVKTLNRSQSKKQ